MPWIEKPKRQPKQEKQKSSPDERKKLRVKFYNSQAWRNLRLCHMREHPLCEKCLSKGKVVAGEDIHHIVSPFDYDNMKVNMHLALDDSNLQTLCSACHQEEHNRRDRDIQSAEEIISALEALFEDVPNED